MGQLANRILGLVFGFGLHPNPTTSRANDASLANGILHLVFGFGLHRNPTTSCGIVSEWNTLSCVWDWALPKPNHKPWDSVANGKLRLVFWFVLCPNLTTSRGIL